MDSSASLIHQDPDRSWITDPVPDHPKETHPNICIINTRIVKYKTTPLAPQASLLSYTLVYAKFGIVALLQYI